MPEHKNSPNWLTPILGGLLIISIIGNGFLFYRLDADKQAITNLQFDKVALGAEGQALMSELAKASTTIKELSSKLETAAEAIEDLEEDYKKERNKNEDFEDQLRDLGSIVGDLDKLSKTDEELLQKYSKVYFLNENYIPSKLRKIDDEYILANRDVQFFHGDALPFLEDMMKDAEDDGIDLKIASAYRSFDAQTELKGQYTQTYGSGANAFSADQGYSEHQLGTTADLTSTTVGGTYTTFKDTSAYQWLLDNAYKYGFIESYPEDNGFYVFEPWHWRFVGTDLARDLHRADAHFYDWDQRKIDTYLLNIFD